MPVGRNFGASFDVTDNEMVTMATRIHETAAVQQTSRLSKALRATFAAGVVLTLAHLAFRSVPHDVRIAVLHEDGPLEYLGAISFFAASILFFLAFRSLRADSSASASRLKPYVALVLAGLFFFAAAEEISWGQRLFGWGTPESLREANHQDETNLHNLGISGFDEYRLFTLAWYPYVLGLPLLAAAWLPARRLIARLAPVVSLWAWPFGLLYLVNDVVSWVVGKSLTIDGRYDDKIDFPRVEMRESVFAMLTVLTAYLLLRSVRARAGAAGEDEPTVGRGRAGGDRGASA